MGFIKTLVGLPIVAVILVFAFVNNNLAEFSLWPFDVEITVSQSVAVLFFVIFGFLLGNFFSWLSYAPLRKDLKQQRKANKKLSKQQQILADTVSGLQGNLEQVKAEKEALMPPKPSWFSFLKKQTAERTDEDSEENS